MPTFRVVLPLAVVGIALIGAGLYLPSRKAVMSRAQQVMNQMFDGDGNDDVSVLIEIPTEPVPLTPTEHERLKRPPPIAIAGVDVSERPAIPLFEARRGGTDPNPTVSPMLTGVLVRATIKQSALRNLPEEWRGRVFENVRIRTRTARSLSGMPIGTAGDVAARLLVTDLAQRGMTGASVFIGIVDDGINIDTLKDQILGSDVPECGSTPPCFQFSYDLSDGGLTKAPPGHSMSNNGFTHGGMVAFSALIAAPRATIFDVVLTGGGEARIAEAFEAYSTVIRRLTERKQQGQTDPMGVVLVNSWGIWNPDTEDPRGNYVGNAQHKMVGIISELAELGIDVVFAAGDCGPDGPASDCGTVGSGTIYGANSYERVMSVGAVDVGGSYLRYSSAGPGRLYAEKPDVSGFAEFAGFNAVDSGTSAAAPIVAGLIAAYRSQHPFLAADRNTSADAMRNRIIRAVEPCYENGATPPYDRKIGHGIISARCLLLEDHPDALSSRDVDHPRLTNP